MLMSVMTHAAPVRLTCVYYTRPSHAGRWRLQMWSLINTPAGGRSGKKLTRGRMAGDDSSSGEISEWGILFTLPPCMIVLLHSTIETRLT